MILRVGHDINLKQRREKEVQRATDLGDVVWDDDDQIRRSLPGNSWPRNSWRGHRR